MGAWWDYFGGIGSLIIMHDGSVTCSFLPVTVVFRQWELSCFCLFLVGLCLFLVGVCRFSEGSYLN